MLLHLADVHLEWTRLRLAEGDRDAARRHLERARELVTSTRVWSPGAGGGVPRAAPGHRLLAHRMNRIGQISAWEIRSSS